MFFAAIIALAVLAGLVAGTFSASRRLAHILAALCIVLGIAGAIVTGLDADTTDRASSVAFALVGGLVAALLLYGGWLAKRAIPRFFTVPEPRQRELERLPYDVYSAKLTTEPKHDRPAPDSS